MRALLVALAMVWLPALAWGETIKIGATGAVLGALERLASAFEESQSAHSVVVVRPSVGSRGAILGVTRGDFGLGVSARPLDEAEKAGGLVQSELGRTAFVLATRQDGGDGLTLAQLADIHAGRIVTWPDGSRLRLVLRPANDSDTAQLKAMSPEMALAVESAQNRTGMTIAVTDQEAADLIGRTPGALGTTTLALIRGEGRALRVLPIENQTPDDPHWPYVRVFHLIVPERPSAAAAAFAAFVGSPDGRRVLGEAGVWP
ncbi:MAG: substrate-binding domain-containing protein [Alphaproteobacteria bacterium]|nr:substrate-binding domain-containing protein [Alphaproteobacteria bacterium]